MTRVCAQVCGNFSFVDLYSDKLEIQMIEMILFLSVNLRFYYYYFFNFVFFFKEVMKAFCRIHMKIVMMMII